MLSLRRMLAGRGFLAVACVGMAGLADWLFYEREIGWTVGIFSLVLMLLVQSHRWRV